MEPVYCTREDLMMALDVKPSAYMRREVDRACEAGSRAAEGYCHRIFYPEVLTRTFDFPRTGYGYGVSRLYFDEQALVSLTSLSSGGTAINPAYVFRYPDGATPSEWIELDRDSIATFSGGPQRAISITGVWGYQNAEISSGTISANANSSSVTLSVSVPQEVGSLLRIGQERVLVTETGWVSSGQITSATAEKNATSLAVSNGSLFLAGETVLLDGERMRVVDIAGNTLIVQRATGGTVLAAHTSATVYRQLSLTVQRGMLGTAAAAIGVGDAVFLWQPPSLVRELALAYASDIFLQRNSGYARTAGTGESERMVGRNAGVGALEKRAGRDLRRKVRTRAI